MKKILIAMILTAALLLSACVESSYSKLRKVTVFSERTGAIMFRATGNFDYIISKELLTLEGVDDKERSYVHRIGIGLETVYIIEDLGKTGDIKHPFKIEYISAEYESRDKK